MTISRTVLVAAVLLGSLAPGTASAATGSLDIRLAPNVRWPERELVLSLPAKRALNNDQVQLSENGQVVRGARVTSEATNRKRGVVLVIDSSLTMQGQPIGQAILAARSFAQRRAQSTPLGVIFFSRGPRLALAPTTDSRKIKATLAVGPALSAGTKIFDAAAAGVTALHDGGLTSGAVIVLSDGAEAVNGSTTTPVALAAAARRANVRIFSVGLDSRSFDSAALRTMAATTGGRYGEAARPRDLPPLFAAIGERLSQEYLVSYRSSAPAGTPVRIQVRVAGVPGTTALDYRTPRIAFGAAGPGHAAQASGLDRTRVMLIAGIGFVVLTLVLYLVLRPKRQSVVSRVTDFAGIAGAVAPTMADVRKRDEDTEREPSERWRRYAETLELAGIGLTPAALAMWTALVTLAFTWYLGFVTHRTPLIVLALAVPFMARTYVLSRLNARRREFEDQLPDNLQVLASALRAGYSFSAAMAAMAEDAPEPSRTELRRASNDEQLGVDVTESLGAIGQRMANQEIEYVGIVAKMQRESGGNTAEVLDQVIVTIRERQRLKRMVRTLTAQSRMGGAVISAMPLIVGVGMSFLHPGYFDPMFNSPVGVGLFILGAVMLGAGWLTIRKIVDVET
ncbi:MAG: type secretion system protein [Solirubrobacterales bacterium]|nr:type secretion system protein [Solirubrobacterales bacterium]